MADGICDDRSRVSGDDTGHHCRHGESLLAGCPDGDGDRQPGVSLQRRVVGVVTAGGYHAVDPPAGETGAHDGGEIPTARGAYLSGLKKSVIFSALL